VTKGMMDRLGKRHVALPADHGSWVFLLSPLVIGLFAGGRWTTPCLYLIVAALAGFLIRQPLTLAVKVRSGRRSRDTERVSRPSERFHDGKTRWNKRRMDCPSSRPSSPTSTP